ncbi:hypothetical protein XaplCFBP3122_13150 [Xanthomonas arboricola pv. populi]|uniref:Uncharacterized protein n=1 Tax=Xanthomonas arboricola pv. populi TaxID=487823 RepID=A0A2S6Z3F5_9XANT|nr:hypothetical protein XaplCFBP3122_13150 [Xanthomonas arboricola pv. populi]
MPAYRRGTLSGMDAAPELHGRTCGVSHGGTRESAFGRPKHSLGNVRCRAQDRSVRGVGRQRGAASSVGTRRESVPGGSVAASMPPHGPAPGRNTTLPTLLPLIGRQIRVQAPSVAEAFSNKVSVIGAFAQTH